MSCLSRKSILACWIIASREMLRSGIGKTRFIKWSLMIVIVVCCDVDETNVLLWNKWLVLTMTASLAMLLWMFVVDGLGGM